MKSLQALARKVYETAQRLPWDCGVSTIIGGSWPPQVYSSHMASGDVWILSPEIHINGIPLRVSVHWGGPRKFDLLGTHTVAVFVGETVKYPGGIYKAFNSRLFGSKWSWDLARTTWANQGRGNQVHIGTRSQLLSKDAYCESTRPRSNHPSSP